jgi:hypothetical protein
MKKRKIKALFVFLYSLHAVVLVFFIIVAAVLALLLIKVLWSWTIPALCPGAVETGLIARAISWFTAFKVLIAAVFIGKLMGIAAGSR